MVFFLPKKGETNSIIVPDTYSKIQDAIDAAADNDSIMVRSGTYYENINFGGKAITVYSESGSSSTIIDGDANRDGTGDGPVATFSSGEGADSVLDGFTLQNGFTNKGGGIYCTASSPTITNCIITNNTGEHGGGISCYNGASPNINACTITNNTATHSGSGIYCYFSSPTVSKCEISNNDSNYSGGGIYCESSSPTITNCTLTGNEAKRSGGGIACRISSSPVITNCVIAKNEVHYDINERIGGSGGGIFSSSSSPSIINCTITGNVSDRAGGGMYCLDSSLITIMNTIIWENTSGVYKYNEIYPESLTTVTYSNVNGSYTGDGNINSDPLFTDTENNDYQLQANSACIDAASSNTPVPTTDRNGNKRYDDPDTANTGSGENGMYVDMGAYEKQSVTPAAPKVTVPTLGGWGLLLLAMLYFERLRRKVMSL